jgi:hypothetical protein
MADEQNGSAGKSKTHTMVPSSMRPFRFVVESSPAEGLWGKRITYNTHKISELQLTVIYSLVRYTPYHSCDYTTIYTNIPKGQSPTVG